VLDPIQVSEQVFGLSGIKGRFLRAHDGFCKHVYEWMPASAKHFLCVSGRRLPVVFVRVHRRVLR
jgi:hypothetical protein